MSEHKQPQDTTIPSDNGFGLTNVGMPAKFKEAVVKEVEDLGNVVEIN